MKKYLDRNITFLLLLQEIIKINAKIVSMSNETPLDIICILIKC